MRFNTVGFVCDRCTKTYPSKDKRVLSDETAVCVDCYDEDEDTLASEDESDEMPLDHREASVPDWVDQYRPDALEYDYYFKPTSATSEDFCTMLHRHGMRKEHVTAVVDEWLNDHERELVSIEDIDADEIVAEIMSESDE